MLVREHGQAVVVEAVLLLVVILVKTARYSDSPFRLDSSCASPQYVAYYIVLRQGSYLRRLINATRSSARLQKCNQRAGQTH